jgi:hypothetical protein
VPKASVCGEWGVCEVFNVECAVQPKLTTTSAATLACGPFSSSLGLGPHCIKHCTTLHLRASSPHLDRWYDYCTIKFTTSHNDSHIQTFRSHRPSSPVFPSPAHTTMLKSENTTRSHSFFDDAQCSGYT